MTKAHLSKLALLLPLLSLFVPREAAADLTIKYDDAVVNYSVEVEPHGILTPFSPPQGSADAGLGAGLLVGINLADRGFIPNLADSVALGVGLDWVHYFGGRAAISECAEWRGAGTERICVRAQGAGGSGSYIYSPVVMQWNFYLTDQWTVFGEPGMALFFYDAPLDTGLRFGVTPVFNVGGKWHFSDIAALTLRTGYPYTSVGVSLYF